MTTKGPTAAKGEKKRKTVPVSKHTKGKHETDSKVKQGKKSVKGEKKAKHENKESPKPDREQREVWSKSKKKRMRKLLGRKKHSQTDRNLRDGNAKEMTRDETNDISTTIQKQDDNPKKSSLQKSFLARLSGSRFRELNEDLYTTTSEKAFAKYSKQPELYEQYHQGFRKQVEQWPANPVNLIVKWLTRTRGRDSECIVADFGCGDAELAKKLLSTEFQGNCPFKVHSFDLVASCDLVVACDMANVPLESKSVDVVIFCLALMGTNLADFIREAHRVLKEDGILKIAEVRSRFESQDDSLEKFIQTLFQLGFSCVHKDRSNKMFVILELKLNGRKPDKKLEYTAKPCIYKRR